MFIFAIAYVTGLDRQRAVIKPACREGVLSVRVSPGFASPGQHLTALPDDAMLSTEAQRSRWSPYTEKVAGSSPALPTRSADQRPRSGSWRALPAAGLRPRVTESSCEGRGRVASLSRPRRLRAGQRAAARERIVPNGHKT